jgi:hypothetical protein
MKELLLLIDTMGYYADAHSDWGRNYYLRFKGYILIFKLKLKGALAPFFL